MDKEMKKRMIMLGGLVILGIMLAIVGNTLGAGELIHDAINKITGTTKVVVEGNNATIYEDGTIIGKVELKETKEGSNTDKDNYKHPDIFELNMTKEKWLEENRNIEIDMNKTRDKMFEIAKKDSRVKELTEGKDYILVGGGTMMARNNTHELRLNTLVIEVNGKSYEITIDANAEKVLSVKETDKHIMHTTELSFFGTENQSSHYGNNTNNTVSNTVDVDERVMALFDDVKKDPKVKELIEGKNYKIHSWEVHAGVYGDAGGGIESGGDKLVRDKLVRILSINLNVEGKDCVIVMDVDSKDVLFVGEVDKLKEDLLKIAKNDARLQRIIEEKNYVVENAEITSKNKAQLMLVKNGSEQIMPSCLIEIDLSNNTVSNIEYI